MAWFNKYYRCSKGHEWQDEWDCLCDDRCPVCNESCEPYDHAELDEGKPTEIANYPLQSHSIPFIMLIRKDSICETDLQNLIGKEERSHHLDGESSLLHPTTDPS